MSNQTTTVSELLDPLAVDKFVNPVSNLLAPGFFIDAIDPKKDRKDNKDNKDDKGGKGETFDISMSQGTHDFGLGTGIANTWGYHSSSAPDWNNAGLNYLGPTIVAQRDNPVTVNWISKLPKQHLLPVDPTVHWAFTNPADHMLPDITTISKSGVPVVTHLHGGHSQSQYDGLPDAWFASTGLGGQLAINRGNVQTYTYQNDQEAATLWYHDHALGVTRLNVYAGLAGFYILRDRYDTGIPDNPKTSKVNENPLNLPVNYDLKNNRTDAPKPDGLNDTFYEYPLVIQDKIFQKDGQLFYPSANADLVAAGLAPTLPASVPTPSVIPEFAAGNVILVNGKAWPVLDVEPRQYRFRLLNGSDSRFYNFTLPEGLQFTQIGTDGGLLNAPVQLTNLELAPGQRADVVIDFAGFQGKKLILNNDAEDSLPVPNNPETTGQIMAFQVGNQVTVPDLPLSATLRGSKGQPAAITLPTSVSRIDELDGTFGSNIVDPLTGLPVAKQVGLFEADDTDFDPYGRITPLLGTVQNGALKWEDPITEKIQLGQTEIWEFYNTTMDAHPIHLHALSFQLLDRQEFSATQIDPLTGLASSTAPLTNIKLDDNFTRAADNEAGWLDTVVVNPGEVVRIAATFDLPGEYVWHCHILSHEDNEMMRPYSVVNPLMPAVNPLQSSALLV